MLDGVHFVRQIRQHELVVPLWRHEIDARVGEVNGVPFFVEHVQHVVLDIAVLLLAPRQPAVGNVGELHLLHELLRSGLLENLEQSLVLGATQLCLVEIQRRFVVVAGFERLLAGGDQRIYQVGLLLDQSRHRGVVLGIFGVAFISDGAGDDERRPGFVDEHRVHFVDDGVDVVALHPMFERLHHVVAQVIEAELVVGAVGDVALVGGAALHGARLGVVDAADGQTEVFVDVPHPLRVAPGQIGVDRDQVRAFAG